MDGTRLGTVLLTVAMVAVAAPGLGAQGTSVREDNRAFLLEQNPGAAMDDTVEVHHGDTVETTTVRQGLEMALDRAGDANLRALAQPAAAHETIDTVVGDVWLMGFGEVECGTTTTVAGNPAPEGPLVPGLWLYDGELGYNAGSAAEDWIALSWTTTVTVDGSGPVHYGGNSDFFCIEGSMGILFPYIDGYATANDAGDLPHPLAAS
jgi:hypothetical protein